MKSDDNGLKEGSMEGSGRKIAGERRKRWNDDVVGQEALQLGDDEEGGNGRAKREKNSVGGMKLW